MRVNEKQGMISEMKESKRRLLTAIDLQRDYQLGRSSVYALLHRSDLPVVCIGSRRFMLADEFDAWLREHALNAVNQ